jgi:hypothetical protein
MKSSTASSRWTAGDPGLGVADVVDVERLAIFQHGFQHGVEADAVKQPADAAVALDLLLPHACATPSSSRTCLSHRGVARQAQQPAVVADVLDAVDRDEPAFPPRLVDGRSHVSRGDDVLVLVRVLMCRYGPGAICASRGCPRIDLTLDNALERR